MNQLWNNLPEEQREGLETLFRENPSLKELFKSRTDPATSRALRILSLAHLFDSRLYNEVLLKRDPDLPAFDQLLENPDIERVPRRENHYWLRSTAESRWLDEWRAVPREERNDWAKEIATWLQLNDGDKCAVLSLYLSYDLSRALEYLKQEYQKAD